MVTLSDSYYYAQEDASFKGLWKLRTTPLEAMTIIDVICEATNIQKPEVVFTGSSDESYATRDHRKKKSTIGLRMEPTLLEVIHETAHVLADEWGIDEGPTGHSVDTFMITCLAAAILEESL